MNAISSLSPMCLSGISGLATSSFQQCLNVTGLESILLTNGSIVTPLDHYLMDFCPSKACSNDTLKNASMTIASACQSNTGKGAMDGLDLGKIIPAVLYNFDDIKAAACIEHKSNMSYCIPELLTNIERASGLEFNVSTIESLASGGVTDILARLSSIPSSSYCTDCGSAFVTEALMVAERFNVSMNETSMIRDYAQKACPNFKNFGSTSLPSGIATATNSTSSKRKHSRALTLD